MGDATSHGPTVEHPSGPTAGTAQHPASTPHSFSHLVHPASDSHDSSKSNAAERTHLPPIQYTPGPFNPYPDPALAGGSTGPYPHAHASSSSSSSGAMQRHEQLIASSSRLAPLGNAPLSSLDAMLLKRPVAPSSGSAKAAGKARTASAGGSAGEGSEGGGVGGVDDDDGDELFDHKRKKQKRAEQNRQAQRAFRERREKWRL